MALLTRCSLWYFLPSSLLRLSLGTSPDGLCRLLSVPTAWPPVCTQFNHVATNKQKQLWHINPSDEDVNTIFLFLLLHQPGFGSVGKISKLHLTREKHRMTWSAMRFKAVAGPFRSRFMTKPALFLASTFPGTTPQQPVYLSPKTKVSRHSGFSLPTSQSKNMTRAYLRRPLPITFFSALLSFDLIHTRKCRSGGGEKTYASHSSGAAGNILTSSRNKPLNIATKIGCEKEHSCPHIVPNGGSNFTARHLRQRTFLCGSLNYCAFPWRRIYSIGMFTGGLWKGLAGWSFDIMRLLKGFIFPQKPVYYDHGHVHSTHPRFHTRISGIHSDKWCPRLKLGCFFAFSLQLLVMWISIYGTSYFIMFHFMSW